MDVVAAMRAPTPMSRRTRHAHVHHQVLADPLPPPPLLPPPPTRTPGCSNGVHVQQQQPSQRRLDLEKEVAELKQQLSNEQTVHHVLERALNPASGRSIVLNIPACIPSKAKELLAELVLVEEEIARLESQITTMKGGLTAAQHQRASAMAPAAHSSYPPSVYTNGGNVDRGGGMTGNGMSVHTPVPTSVSEPTRPVSNLTTAYSSYPPPSVYITKGNDDANGGRGGGGGSKIGQGTTVHTPAPTSVLTRPTTKPTTTYNSYPPLSVYISNGSSNVNGGRGGEGGGGAKMGDGTIVHAPTSTLASTTAYSSYPPSNGTAVAHTGPPSVSTRQAATPRSSYPTGVYRNRGNGNVGGNTNVGAERMTCNGNTVHASVRQPSDQVAPEIKSMFFISQAMNAEYLKRHLATNERPAKIPKDHENKGSGAATSAYSPKLNSSNIFALPPRNSLYKQAEKTAKAIQEPSPTAPPPTTVNRDDQTKIHPNKLSERIVKCLAVIFIRLLRSSRAAEMEKSGNLARSGNLQGSFRIDTTLNVAAAKEKERGQQDHYGIFRVQDSVVRDIGPYKNLVRFTSTAFDLRGFSSSPLLTKLREMLEALQEVDLRFLTHQQKLAFWLNIYNTCIMHGILQHGLPSNSEKLLVLKNKATINVSGKKFNALVIENFILRQPSSLKEEFWKCDVDVEEQQVRNLYGLNSSEPNILFALCCGIRSSPALRIYKAERVMIDLEKAKLDYLQASLVVTSTRRLMIPSLVHCNMHDFAKDMESLLRWICGQLPTSWSLRKSMVDCLRGQQGDSKVEDAVEVIPYDYEFQYLLPM